LASDLKLSRWKWLGTCLAFLVLAIGFQRAVELTDTWLARFGFANYLGLVLDALATFLAAWVAGSMFMRFNGYDMTMRRKIGMAYAVTFVIWTALSSLLIANMLHFAPVTLGLAGLAVIEAAIGALLVIAAIRLRGRLFDHNFSRRAAAAGVS